MRRHEIATSLRRADLERKSYALSKKKNPFDLRDFKRQFYVYWVDLGVAAGAERAHVAHPLTGSSNGRDAYATRGNIITSYNIGFAIFRKDRSTHSGTNKSKHYVSK